MKASTRISPTQASTGRYVAGLLLLVASLGIAEAAQQDIVGPPGSAAFGKTVTLLPNGNLVITDPDGPVSGVGAVHLYTGSGQRISTLTGSAANDHVGSGGVFVLINGDFAVGSPTWDNGAAADAGALTWIDGDTGLEGIVTPSNSIVGSSAGDRLGAKDEVVVLPNGHYVIRAASWDNGSTADAGAVSWVDGRFARSGPLSPTNSLVGTSANDQVGLGGVHPLSAGRYVVSSRVWNNGAVSDVGAITVASAAGLPTGIVSPANSLVGSSAGDTVGSDGVYVLGNGNFVVASGNWNNGAVSNAGAVTWVNGTTGLIGTVSPSNSLVGTQGADQVGSAQFSEPVVALSNGNYVVASPRWNAGSVVDVGAVTWANGATGRTGLVSAANSLVGSSVDDLVGYEVTALTNGNYVVESVNWDNGASGNVGAVTWANGTTGRTGTVSASNSLVGSTPGDLVGNAHALSNGHYVVASLAWDNGAMSHAGAATWCNGTTGRTGLITPANSLVGDAAGDMVGFNGVLALVDNGNYVVLSSKWSNGSALRAGASTWGNGATGITGVVSPSNSLVGSATDDGSPQSGGSFFSFAIALPTGDYVVGTPFWNKGAIVDAGAVTYGFGTGGRVGAISATNSLTGVADSDRLGDALIALPDGRYISRCDRCTNAIAANGGAMTLARGNLATTVNATNSVLGTVSGGGFGMSVTYDPVFERMIVGRPASNVVSLFTLPGATGADAIFKSGFE